jgi:hypothetical protein
MSVNLDIKKAEVSLLQAKAVIAELELKIIERYEDIKRIEEHIVLQKKREQELTETLEKLKGDSV